MNFYKRYSPIFLLILPVFLVLPSLVYAQAEAASGFQEFIWVIVNNVFGLMVGLAGKILDAGLNTFVIGFGTQFLHTGVGVVVDDLWTKVRDIFNLTFIFGLVYIGFKMILNSDDSGTRKWLIHLIMAALLVNFSLYITKFIVDVTNITATQIAVGGFGMTVIPPETTPQVQISTTLMSNFGLSTIFGGDGTRTLESLHITQGGGWGYIFGEMILFIIAAFVFAAGGLMLMIRYAALVLYMVLSPMMFLGWVFPGLQSVTSTYWKGFLGRAFFAPVYVLLVYFGAEIIRYYFSTSAAGNQSNFQNVLSGQGAAISQSFSNTIPPFILSCIFLLAAVVVGNKLGADGASTAINIGNNIRNRAQRTIQRGAVGTARFAGRNTAGYAAQGVNATSEAVGRRYNRIDANLRSTKGGRIFRNAASVVTLGALSDKNVKAAVAAGSKASVFGSETRSQVRARNQARQTLNNSELDKQSREEALAKQMKAHKDNKAIVDSTDPAVTDVMKKAAQQAMINAQQALAPVLRNMSADELLTLAGTKGGKETIQSSQFAAHMTDAQIKAMADSGLFTREEIEGKEDAAGNTEGGLREARNDGTLAATTAIFENTNSSATELESAFADLSKTIRGLSSERLAGMGKARLTNDRIAMNLSDAQIDDLQKSGQYTTADINDIKVARNRGHAAMAATGGASLTASTHATVADPAFVRKQREQLMKRDVQQAGKLPVALFADRNLNMAEHISPQVLEQRLKSGDVSGADLDNIRTNIDTYINDLFVSDPTKATRVKNQWKSWNDKSAYGAQLGLTSI